MFMRIIFLSITFSRREILAIIIFFNILFCDRLKVCRKTKVPSSIKVTYQLIPNSNKNGYKKNGKH